LQVEQLVVMVVMQEVVELEVTELHFQEEQN
jgi:hypothetical protein